MKQEHHLYIYFSAIECRFTKLFFYIAQSKVISAYKYIYNENDSCFWHGESRLVGRHPTQQAI